jgi:ribokinase
MSRPQRALCFGSVHHDVTYRVPRIVAEGETVRSTERSTRWGGKGLNQAIALGGAGAETCLMARIGHDAVGLHDVLRARNVSQNLLGVDNAEPTGHAMVQLDAHGRNSIVVYPGANRTHDLETIDQVICGFSAGDLLITQNETNLAPEALRLAKGRGMTTAYNPSPLDEACSDVDLDVVDYLFVNEHEALALTGASSWKAALSCMVTAHPGLSVILTRGGAGATFSGNGKQIEMPAETVEVVDTTGAGDTFTGYFLAMLMRGETPRACLEIATRAASLAVGRPGAADAVPHSYEL